MLIGGILAFITVTILFGFFSVLARVAVNLELPIRAGMNANLIYSCVVAPIAILIMSVILISRKYPCVRKAIAIFWLGILGLGTTLTMVSSALGGSQWIINTPTPTQLPSSTSTITEIPTNTNTSTSVPSATFTLTPTVTMTPTPTITTTPTLTPTLTLTNTPTFTPSPTLTPLSCVDIEQAFETKTDLQWQDYLNTIVGKKFSFSGTVGDVDTSRIWLRDNNCQEWLTFVYLYVSWDLRTVNKGQFLQGIGTIRNVYDFLGLNIEVFVHTSQ